MKVHLDPITGELTGTGISESRRTIAGLKGYFRDEVARESLDQNCVVYRVQAFEPQPEGTPGAICCATTFLEPGLVGDEWFLTRGHFHVNQDRPEMEVTVSGEVLLILMTQDRQTRVEEIRPGSVHHVPLGTAHRVANTGDGPLVFVSYWASETGHDYATIAERGFSARVRRIGGETRLVAEAE